jgi:elongation factor G
LGLGQAHIDVAIHHLHNKFGVDVETTIPKVSYRETITRQGQARYRHKKQTGGAGQFAEIEMLVEPSTPGAGYEFEWRVFGGAISSSFQASIEKGIKQVMEAGVLAGYPIQDVRCIVLDGKEHPVDSKPIAFEIAARHVFREAFEKAGPVLLEPRSNLRSAHLDRGQRQRLLAGAGAPALAGVGVVEADDDAQRAAIVRRQR